MAARHTLPPQRVDFLDTKSKKKFSLRGVPIKDHPKYKPGVDQEQDQDQEQEQDQDQDQNQDQDQDQVEDEVRSESGPTQTTIYIIFYKSGTV